MQYSIIIPSINHEVNITRCFESITLLDWQCAQYEVIVVGNGASEVTADIARKFGAKLILKSGLTLTDLRSCGARVAKGQVLMFLDPDCKVSRACLVENFDCTQQITA